LTYAVYNLQNVYVNWKMQGLTRYRLKTVIDSFARIVCSPFMNKLPRQNRFENGFLHIESVKAL